MKGLVYFRLALLEGGDDATIVYQVGNFQVVHTLDSDFASVTLPPTETVDAMPSYTLDQARNASLQQTKDGSNTFLKVFNAKFVANNARMCVYLYTEVDNSTDGYIIALATIPVINGPQRGLEYNDGNLRVKRFPRYMKIEGTNITQNGFFYLMQRGNNDTVLISPVSDPSLYLTSDADNNASFEPMDSVTGVLSWASYSDCSSRCIKNRNQECQNCDCDD